MKPAAWCSASLILLVVALAPGADTKPAVSAHTAPGAVRFALLGAKGTAPAPTLFVFATDQEASLRQDEFNKVGRLLGKHGFLCVSLDVPCHGADYKADEPGGIDGWRARLEKGDPLLPAFTARASAVLDHLIKDGYTDPRRIAACGTSRGGFIALHFAAAEPRVRCVAAFAPVTNLLALREFVGMEKHAATRELDLINHANKLAGRPVWVCIGNQDERVNTDDAISFTRRLSKLPAAPGKPAPVELHVMPTVGHRIHDTAHEEAAVWVRATLDAEPLGK